MPESFSTEQIEHELALSETPAEVLREFELGRVRSACLEYNIRFSKFWLSPAGRIGLAQVIAARLGQQHAEAKRLEAEWLGYLEGENG
jgi:hypothetical protein